MRLMAHAVLHILLSAAVLHSPHLPAATVTDIDGMASCGYSGEITLDDHSTIKVRLALTEADKKRGLSGKRETDFAEDEALFMVFFNNDQRSINMGDTHFNVDVFYLDDALKVVGLQRNLKAHPGKDEPPTIENSEWVHARHIMEMRSDSPYAGMIKKDMAVRWISKPTVKEIEFCMAKVWKKQQAQEREGLSAVPTMP